jgi:hypothetical protein
VRTHHVGYDAQPLQKSAQHDRKGVRTMTALGIITTWLTLTGAGFAGLSALRRAGAREGGEIEAGLTAQALTPMPTMMMKMMPLSELRAPMLADARAPIPKALLG